MKRAPAPGGLIGPYEVVKSIGAGGMGEVYRARDTKLGLDVTIRVFPEDLSRDKERLDGYTAGRLEGVRNPRRMKRDRFKTETPGFKNLCVFAFLSGHRWIAQFS